MPTTCGSKILEGWQPPYDATSPARLREAGRGHPRQDQHGRVRDGLLDRELRLRADAQPVGPDPGPRRVVRWLGRRGRRVRGAAGASAPTPAARSASPPRSAGIVGVKPTYGGSSRYGLVAFASSLDTPGPLARTVLDAALLHEAISGHDPCDSTSIDAPGAPVVAAARHADVAGLRDRRGHGARRRGLPAAAC